MVFKSSLNNNSGGGGGSVNSVTGLNTNNADPANPVVRISVDGVTITGAGTPASPLVSVGGGGATGVSSVNNSDGTLSIFPTAGAVVVNIASLSSGNILIGNVSGVPTGRTLAGDATLSNNGTITLATVNSNVGTFGSPTAIPVITANAKGLGTAYSTVAVVAPAGTLTGTTIGSTVVTSSLTTVGTLINLTVTNPITGSITGNAATATALQTGRTINAVTFDGTANIVVPAAAGTLTGAVIGTSVVTSTLTSVGTLTGGSTGTGFTLALGTSTLTGQVPVVNGGTGVATLTAHGLLVGEGTGNVASVTVGTAGRLLIDQGASADPSFNIISGDITVTNTGVTTVGPNKITNSKMATSSVNTLAGYDGSGNFSDVAIGTNLTLSGGTLNATGGGGSGGVSSVNNSDGTLSVFPTAGAVVINIATLSSGNILIGNVSGVATSRAMVGDATLTNNGTITLATVNSNVGSFGAQSLIPIVTLNGKGLTTAASTIAVVAPAGTLTGTTIGSTVVSSSLTTVGTLINLTVTNPITGSVTGNAGTATALATARAINGVNFDGSAAITVPAAAGTLTGTTIGTTVVTSTLTSVGILTGGATGVGFTVNVGSSTVAGNLATIHGGTGLATLTGNAVLIGAGTSNVAFATIGTAGRILIDQGSGVNPSFNIVSGDVTITNTGITTIGPGAITVSKMANLANNTMLANNSDATAAPSAVALTNSRSINQSTHGFSAGNVVRLSGATTYTKAQADTAANAEAVGMVSSSIDTNNFVLVTQGYISGLSGFTANTVYFLDPAVAGGLTATEPTIVGQIDKPCFIADSTTSGYFINYRGEIIANAVNAVTSDLSNLLFNGGFQIDQEFEFGSVVLATGPAQRYDQYFFSFTNSTAAISTQIIADAPANTPLVNSMKYTITTGGTVAAGDIIRLIASIESTNMAKLQFGTANALATSLSFYVKSSVTGTYSVSILNPAANRAYVTTYAINSANTWERKTITNIPGDTTGTWPATAATATRLGFWLSGGSSSQTSTLNAWQAANVNVANTQTNTFLSAGSATFQITGIQWEIGTTANAWQYVPYETDLLRAQRCYRKSFPTGTAVAQNAGVAGAVTVKNPIALGDPSEYVQFDPPMRASPTMVTYNPSVTNANWRDITAAADATVSVDPATTIGTTGVLIATTGTVTTLGDVLAIHYTANARF